MDANGRQITRSFSTGLDSSVAADILNRPRAVAMSVYVIRAFVKMREDIAANSAILTLSLSLMSRANQDHRFTPARFGVHRSRRAQVSGRIRWSVRLETFRGSSALPVAA